MAHEMSRLGHEVIIVAGNDSLRKTLDVSKEDDVTVLQVKSGEFKNTSKLMRAVTEVSLSGMIWSATKDFFQRHPCDLIVYYSPTIFWSKLVNKLKGLNRQCGTYLVLRDLFPQWALDAGLLNRYGPTYWYFKSQEMRLYKTADVIGVQSPANLDYFTASGLAARFNLEVLFNWTKICDESYSLTGLRQKLNLQDKVIFMYGGNIGVAQDIDNIVRLAYKLKDEKKIFILLIGEGSEYDRIQQELDRSGLSNIKLLPAVPHEEYISTVAECDVGLISLRQDLKTQNFPGKMLSYMELKKPMLASINPGNDLSSIIYEYDAGLSCMNGDDKTFYHHALKLANDPDLRSNMGRNARRLLRDKFDVSSAAKQILSHFIKDGMERCDVEMKRQTVA
jgi:glycosyltransferase involved in cell wall biosynthesis